MARTTDRRRAPAAGRRTRKRPPFHWLESGYILFWTIILCLTLMIAVLQTWRANNVLDKVSTYAAQPVTNEEMDDIREYGHGLHVYGLDLEDSMWVWGNQ